MPANHSLPGTNGRCSLFALSCALSFACSSTPPMEVTTPDVTDGAAKAAATYVAQQVEQLRPLLIEANRTWYAASVSGSDADWASSKSADVAVDAFWSNTERFAKIRALKQLKVEDPLLARQIDMLYRSSLGKQVEPALLNEITGLQKLVEQLFNTYRGTVAGEQVSHNQIEDILTKSTDSARLKEAWEAQKGVGDAVAPKLIELVKLRNKVAKKLGFRDYYAMRLAESELDEKTLLSTFDELDRLTSKRFLETKAVVDERLAKRLGISVDELMPWHYQNPFFQEPPAVFETGLDELFKKQDTLALTRRFFDGIALPASDIIERSDLYEKPGKTPHAFAIDIDRVGDVRVLANIVPGLKWQNTMVHEIGHAVYDKYVDSKLPWLLREATHAITTEGLAMMLDYVVANPKWAQALGVMDAAQAQAAAAEARAYQAFAELQFSRWTQVMLRFERGMYENPDRDLNKLWWDLVERYQSLRRPPGRSAPDYASKIHLVVAPVYYQNYMLGKLFAAQVHEAIAKYVDTEPADTIYVADPRVGKFLIDKVFGPGARYDWNELTEFATGNKLAPDAFARRF